MEFDREEHERIIRAEKYEDGTVNIFADEKYNTIRRRLCLKE